MDATRMAIRLQDIASDLNLSKMTISKVLRGQTDVSAATKARVLARVRELNYRPNATARSLRTGQTYSAGLVVRSMGDPAVTPIIRGMNEALRAEGYSLIVSSADGDASMVEREAELQLSRQVDLLFFHLQGEAVSSLSALRAEGTPVIYVGQEPAGRTGHCVGLREQEVGHLAVAHVIGSGASRIAYLRGPRTAAADERFAGFLQGMREAGATIRQEWIAEGVMGAGQYWSGVSFAERLLGGRVTPDGVIAYTDSMGAGVCDAAVRMGWRVPEQVQVVGCGNDEEICEMRCSLTSIDLEREESGRRAAKLGLKLIRQGSTGKAEGRGMRGAYVAPKIVQRGSTRGSACGMKAVAGPKVVGAR